MSPQPLWRRHPLPLLALAGCCSALLTMGLSITSAHLNQYFLAPGLALGILIPLYFTLHVPIGSAWRSLSFLLSSIAAFQASMCAAFAIRLVLPANLNNPVTIPSLFAGGLVGGFIALMAAAILFGSSQGNPDMLRILAASLATGVLGVVGWFAARLLRLPPTPVKDFWRLNSPEFLSLYTVWQTGTALLIGWLVIRERAPSAPGSLPFTGASLGPPRKQIAVASLFFCAVFGFLGWFAVRNVQGEKEVARRDQEFKSAAERRDQVFKQYLAETPPADALPPIQKLTVDQALILADVGGFRPQRSASVEACRPVLNGTLPEPPCVIYQVAYTLPNPPEPTRLTYAPRITVQLTQYPNDAWAQHKGRGYTSPLDKPESVTVTSATRTDRIMRTTWEIGVGTNASYIWPSGSIVVRVNGVTSSLPEDFLRRYLAKYPSSL